jgi:hypothetical protein
MWFFTSQKTSTVSENEDIPVEAEVRAQLGRMLASKRFIAQENPAEFLKLVVEKAIKNELITQAIIGCELFPTKYEKNDISDGRVTALKLRAALAGYYAQEGRYDPVIITLPTPPGSNARLPTGAAYKPAFRYHPQSQARKEYSRGLSMLSQLNLNLTEGYFVAAISLQPGYPEPYLALATTYLLFPMCVTLVFVDVSGLPEGVNCQTWLAAVRRLLANALTINRKSWRAHILRGVGHCYQHEWKKAGLAFDTALTISPEKTRDDAWSLLSG